MKANIEENQIIKEKKGKKYYENIMYPLQTELQNLHNEMVNAQYWYISYDNLEIFDLNNNENGYNKLLKMKETVREEYKRFKYAKGQTNKYINPTEIDEKLQLYIYKVEFNII